MAKEWTDDEVQAEIKAAVAIVREDKEKAQYASLHERYGKEGSGDGSGKPPEGDKAPPRKEGDPDPNPTEKKRSLWWGDSLE